MFGTRRLQLRDKHELQSQTAIELSKFLFTFSSVSWAGRDESHPKHYLLEVMAGSHTYCQKQRKDKNLLVKGSESDISSA